MECIAQSECFRPSEFYLSNRGTIDFVHERFTCFAAYRGSVMDGQLDCGAHGDPVATSLLG
jgi:hypothetical protein